VEAVLAGQLDAMLEAGELPDLKALREQYAPREAQCPDVEVQMPPVAVYDELLEKVAA
ncbi:IS21 family transposase, partial [Paraburkholderia guartelaensis]